MGNYIQTGHESWTLPTDPDIGAFGGIVLSPVNDSPDEIAVRLAKVLEQKPNLDIILDPQLYNPVHHKGQLPKWAYFGQDFDTADKSDFKWWAATMPAIAAEARRVGATTVCSPAPIPRVIEDGYYKFAVDLADEMQEHARPHGLETAITLIVPLASLHDPSKAMEIASTVSGSRCDRVFLNFLTPDGMPQREPLRDQASLATAVHLIRLLSRQLRVHVASASHDVVLWLGAGAQDVSTGKFMNLRRFSPARWSDDESKGRNVLSYWSEESLLTLIREQDVLLLDRAGWFKDATFADNPASAQILNILRSGEGTAWRRLSWVQYMRWFANTASSIRSPDQALETLTASHHAWRRVEEMEFLFVDQKYNDGTHVIAWLNSLREGLRR